MSALVSTRCLAVFTRKAFVIPSPAVSAPVFSARAGAPNTLACWGGRAWARNLPRLGCAAGQTVKSIRGQLRGRCFPHAIPRAEERRAGMAGFSMTHAWVFLIRPTVVINAGKRLPAESR